MTDTLTPAAAVAGAAATAVCGCAVPPPMDVAEELRELEARREAVERRLAGLSGEARPRPTPSPRADSRRAASRM